MMKKIPVKDHRNLVRDAGSSFIVNTDTEGYKSYVG